MKTNISVLLSTLKRCKVLKKTLNSFCGLNTEGLSWELILVDNADDGATAAVVKEFEKKLPIVFLVESNPGKNKALNRALPYAKGHLIVFTDDDIIADPDWLQELWTATQRWPDYAVFGGKIIPHWPEKIPPWGENHPINKNLFGQHSPWEVDTPYSKNDFLALGANIAIRRKIFDQGYKFNDGIGPNSSIIYRMGSEMELLFRLRDDGVRQIYIPTAVVSHQIRPDQVSREWIRRRGFRVGYSDFADVTSKGKTFCNVNLYLWKRLVGNLIAYVFYKLIRNIYEEHNYYMKLYKTKGKMFAQNLNRTGKVDGILIKFLKYKL